MSASSTPKPDVHIRSRLYLDRELRIKVTFIDGDEGVLLHRGYPIDELAEKSDFIGSATSSSMASSRRRRRGRSSARV